jgi:TolB-like protein/Flp pilus assembly protein TadD
MALEPRGAFAASQVWLWRHQPDKAIEALNAFTSDSFNDTFFNGPKSGLLALAHEIAGRPDAARAEWENTRSITNRLLAENRAQPAMLAWKAIALARLGEKTEAEQLLRQLEQTGGLRSDFWSCASAGALLRIAVGRGDEVPVKFDTAPRTVNSKGGIPSPQAALKLNPVFDSIRATPEFQKWMAAAPAPKAKETAAPVAKADDKFAPADKSIAVLAFANFGGDKENEYFSDGITEELLNVLAKVPGLRIAARTSAFYFKDKNVPIPEIAQKLNVAYVVEGSVQKSGTRVKITAQLIKASDGFHVWSDTFTRELKDVFAMQDEIAGLIAQNLQLKLAAASGRETIRPEIYELLLQARAQARQQSNEGRRQAIALYRRVLATEPRLAAAWAEMAQAYVALGRFGGLPIAEGMREARAAAQQALTLDPDQPAGLVALGLVQRTADWDWRGAQRSLQRAMDLAPGDPGIMSDAAVLFFNVGRVDEALALARQAVERDPLNASAQFYLGALLELKGRYEESLRPLAKAVELAPAADEFHTHLARSLISLGRLAEAEKTVELEPNEAYRLVGRAELRHAQGDQAGAVKALDELIAKYGAEIPGYVALTYAAMGNKEQAFAWLDRAVTRRDAAVVWMKTVFGLRALQSDPRWHEFLMKLGLADEQLK